MTLKKMFYPVVFLFITLTYLTLVTYYRPKVLVLHSYNENFAWVKSLNATMTPIWQKNAYLRIKTIYMSAKRHPDKIALKTQAKQIKKVIADWQPDVLLTFDDAAQAYVGKDLVKKGKIKLVFAGVSAKPEQYGYTASNRLTGVLQYPPIEGLKQSLEAIFPKYKKLTLLSDNSLSSTNMARNFKHFAWGDLRFEGVHQSNQFKDWKNHVLTANQQQAIIVISGYQTLKDKGKALDGKAVVAWTLAHASVPVVGLFRFYVDSDGGDIAVISPVKQQGQTAAELVLDIIKNKLKNPEFREPKTFALAINRKRFAQHYPTIKLPLIYQSLANL